MPTPKSRRKSSATSEHTPLTILNRSRSNSRSLISNQGDEAPVEISERTGAALLVDQPSKWKNWWVRGFWTIIMVACYIDFVLNCILNHT